MNEKLFEAVKLGHLDAVQLLLTDSEVLAAINNNDEHGRTALHLAAEAGHVEIARCLLANGANIRATDRSFRTPLHLAAESSGQECGMVKFLCSQDGVDINAKDNNNLTPLMLTRPNKPMTINCLLEAGAEIRVIQVPGRSFQERCLPHSEAFKAVLFGAPNCLMTFNNEFNQRLVRNLKRRLPKDKPDLSTVAPLQESHRTQEPSARKMVMQLLEARINLTRAYVSLFHGETEPGEINRQFSEALQHSRDLVEREIVAILDGSHQLLKHNHVEIQHLIREIKPVLCDLSKEAFTTAKIYLSSPDPPSLEKFNTSIIHALKLSRATVSSEIDALSIDSPQTFNSLTNALIKVASSNSDDSSAHINHALNHVGLKLLENYMDTINQKSMNPINTEPMPSKENLQLSMICLLLKKPQEYNADIVYCLSELVTHQSHKPTQVITFENLIALYPKTILGIVAELEKKHANIIGVSISEPQSSPFSDLKELAVKAMLNNDRQKLRGTGHAEHSKQTQGKENAHQMDLPLWAKKHMELVQATAKMDKPKVSEPSKKELRDITPKTSPR